MAPRCARPTGYDCVPRPFRGWVMLRQRWIVFGALVPALLVAAARRGRGVIATADEPDAGAMKYCTGAGADGAVSPGGLDTCYVYTLSRLESGAAVYVTPIAPADAAAVQCM